MEPVQKSGSRSIPRIEVNFHNPDQENTKINSGEAHIVGQDNDNISDSHQDISSREYNTTVSDQQIKNLLDLSQQNIIQAEMIDQLKKKMKSQDMMNLTQAAKILQLDEENRALRNEQDRWEITQTKQSEKHRLHSEDQADTITNQTEELKQLNKLCKSLKLIVSTSRNNDFEEEGMTPNQISALDLATFDPKRSGSVSSENVNDGLCNSCNQREGGKKNGMTREGPAATVTFLEESVESDMRVSMSDGTVHSWKGARGNISNLTLPRGIKTRKRVKFSKIKEDDRIDIANNEEKAKKPFFSKNTTRQVSKQKLTALLRVCYLHDKK